MHNKLENNTFTVDGTKSLSTYHILFLISFKRTLSPHVLSPSYKCVTQQINAQQITFSSVSLKNRMNRPIMKLDGMNIICVLMLVFYNYSVFKSVVSIFNLRNITYTYNFSILKKQYIDIDNIFNIKLYNRSIDSNF